MVYEYPSKDLADVFGYKLEPIDEKNTCFYLINAFDEHPEPEKRHLTLSPKEQEETGLLTVILAVIYMKNGVIKHDDLFKFLKDLKIWDDDREMEPFGKVKNLIDDWVKKQQYLAMCKEDTNEDNPTVTYTWGQRATVEVKKSEILKFVSEIYGKSPEEFTEQYEAIQREEGEGIFEV